MIPYRLIHADCLEVLPTLEENSVDTVITDPPYGLKFMGKNWDHGIPGVPFWEAALRVAKPGAVLLAFGGTRTHHRLMCAIEDAGWEIRDCLMWLYGQGFPKSLDISKAIDKAADYQFKSAARRATVEAVEAAGLALPGNSKWDWTTGEHAPGEKWWRTFQEWLPTLTDDNREKVEREVMARGFRIRRGSTVQIAGLSQGEYPITAPATDLAKLWDGWGTALKPAWEPILLAMKPLDGTYAQNAEKWGVAGLWIEGGRIASNGDVGSRVDGERRSPRGTDIWCNDDGSFDYPRNFHEHPRGRWPANLILDEAAAEMLDQQSGERPVSGSAKTGRPATGDNYGRGNTVFNSSMGARQGRLHNDSGGPSRFFYCAKASKAEREAGLDGLPTRRGGGMKGTEDQTLLTGSGNVRNPERRNTHPTVKPLTLMRYLVRLTRTPTGGVVIDPFMGSGTTGMACMLEDRTFIGIDNNAEYIELARKRIEPLAAQTVLPLA